MTLRRGHGSGAGVPRIEVLPPDELPAGVPAPQRFSEPEIRRDELGRPADAESHRAMSSLGGQARAGKSRLARRVALGETFADPRFVPYAKAARAFRTLHVRQLAQTIGGGHCGPAPASMVASAALQLAASRFAFEVLGDMQLGSRLANDSRQNLLAAFEMCSREAVARRAANPSAGLPWLTHDAPDASDEPETTTRPTPTENASEGPLRVSTGHPHDDGGTP